jgi:CRISPR-associated endonuclease/helicase Cas3
MDKPQLAFPDALHGLPKDGESIRLATELWTRFLFSALVDADRLATEHFYDTDARQSFRGFDSIERLSERIDDYLDKTYRPDTRVNTARARVLADCRRASLEPPGFFSLTVPTGGGKTLSSMAFALAHATRHGQRRVIVVAPFTSIIEQNAEVYRTVLGDRDVIEHHSAIVTPEARGVIPESELRRRLAAENWDAPVIVTTAVQFFESLLSNDPSRCRKLHNIARSVVIVDEAQTIPTEYLACLLDVMRELVRAYGCSIVFSTATQPALRARPALPNGITGLREIIADVPDLTHALRRVEVTWPESGGAITPYKAVAQGMVEVPCALAVVHLTRDARLLAELLPAKGRFHLSTRMCASHRSGVLAAIKAALQLQEECRVVSTQLIEAGVDISVPLVFRAMAGLDSVAQAAGRCNRNGLLRDTDGRPVLGRVRVFRAETAPPAGVLRQGLQVAEEMLLAHGPHLDVSDATILEEYFRRLYSRVPHDPHGVQAARAALDFGTVAQLVRLIDDGGQYPLVVPWEDAADRLAHFAARPGREAARGLQQFIVRIRDRQLRALERLGAVAVAEGIGFVLLSPFEHLYSDEFGLLVDEDAVASPTELIH